MKVYPIVQPPGAIILSEGMTLRDYFAAAALHGYLAHFAGTGMTPDPDEASLFAYDAADAMLAARAPQDELPPITGPEVAP